MRVVGQNAMIMSCAVQALYVYWRYTRLVTRTHYNVKKWDFRRTMVLKGTKYKYNVKVHSLSFENYSSLTQD